MLDETFQDDLPWLPNILHVLHMIKYTEFLDLGVLIDH